MDDIIPLGQQVLASTEKERSAVGVLLLELMGEKDIHEWIDSGTYRLSRQINEQLEQNGIVDTQEKISKLMDMLVILSNSSIRG